MKLFMQGNGLYTSILLGFKYSGQIEGREMYLMFTSIFDFNKKVINAIVRLYHTMDDC